MNIYICTVFLWIVVETTILFLGFGFDNYSRETTIQGRKLLNSRTFRVRQLFKGDNYSREETIRGNTVGIVQKVYEWSKCPLAKMIPLKDSLITHIIWTTGCLNKNCQTSNQLIFRIRWHFKKKLFIFVILSRGDLCMDNQFLGCHP